MEPARNRSRSPRYHVPVAEINIIPLVDVTLVLLIIFMATTAFVKDQKVDPAAVAQRELALNLPSARLAVNASPTDVFVLSVDRAGNKYIGSTPTTLTMLHQQVRDAAAKTPQPRVRVDADKDARFQDVLEVVELCQFEGLKNVAIHTAPPKQ